MVAPVAKLRDSVISDWAGSELNFQRLQLQLETNQATAPNNNPYFWI